MIRKLLLFAVLFTTVIFCSSAQTTTQNIQADTSKIAIILCSSVNIENYQNCNPTELTSQDINKIESLLTRFIRDYNDAQKKQYNKLSAEAKSKHVLLTLNLDLFKRQYIPTIDENGDRVVWLNLFCNDLATDWHKEIIRSSGERMCNFKIHINLTKNKTFDFRLLYAKNSI